MYSISFTKQADRALRRMPKKRSALIRSKLKSITADPYAQYNNVTKLQNRPGFRLRVGDLRVIYDIQNQNLVVLVLRVAPRGEAY